MTPPRTVLNDPRLSVAHPLTQPPTLVDEHRVLLRAVHRRADAALALIDAHVWPVAEAETLARFLHGSVLRQASDEEVLLYPRGAPAPLAELGDDHVRVHELTARLARADVRSITLAELRGLIDLLLAVLHRHVIAEEALLAALPGVDDPPSTVSVACRAGSWVATTGEAICIDLGPEPSDDAVQMCIERLLRLQPGESADVRSGEELALAQVCRWLHRFDADGFGLERRGEDDADAALQVSRRCPA